MFYEVEFSVMFYGTVFKMLDGSVFAVMFYETVFII